MWRAEGLLFLAVGHDRCFARVSSPGPQAGASSVDALARGMGMGRRFIKLTVPDPAWYLELAKQPELEVPAADDAGWWWRRRPEPLPWWPLRLHPARQHPTVVEVDGKQLAPRPAGRPQVHIGRDHERR
jgi:hypothetical protein